MIRNESEILNVGVSKPPEVVSRPAGGLMMTESDINIHAVKIQQH